MTERPGITRGTGLVSIIIPTRNSARTIRDCLDSIKNQSYTSVETVVVDAHSTDETPQIAASFGARVISLDSERAAAKNEGISLSRGEFLFFIDSDMVLEKDVVKECVDACNKDQNTAGVVVPERSVGDSFWVRVRDFERSLYAGSKIESARFFKRAPVVAVGGFDEEFVFFEESTLTQRLEDYGMHVNARITFSILHDESNFNLRKWLRKKKYYYDTAEAYSRKYKDAKFQLSATYRLKAITSDGKWKSLVRHPPLMVGLFMLKTLELISSRI